MRKLSSLLIVIILITPAFVCAQQNKLITGHVVNDATGAPIPDCSVFINNSSRGTVTDASGKFALAPMLAGKLEMIVSSIGYETYVLTIEENKLPQNIEIRLKQKASELSAVTIEPFVEDGWQQYGNLFLQNFIGTSVNSKLTRLLNKEVIRFRYSKQKNLVRAFADEPLVVENSALGYRVVYQLENFQMDFTRHTVTFFGYPLFQELTKANAATRRIWKENRRRAFTGSLMHFIRSLFHNQLDQDGFEVREIGKLPNQERSRVEAVIREFYPDDDSAFIYRDTVVNIDETKRIKADSAEYYYLVMRQPVFKDILYPAILTADKLLVRRSQDDKTLFFSHKLDINYRPQKRREPVYHAEISLMTPVAVSIEASGNYFPPTEIFASGSWSQAGKMANILPLDYVPD